MLMLEICEADRLALAQARAKAPGKFAMQRRPRSICERTFAVQSPKPKTSRIILVGLAFLCMGLRATDADPADYLDGKLLVAAREMKDPRFSEAVVYVIAHNAKGAFGLVINRPIVKAPVQELLKGFGAESNGVSGEMLVHYGGPVSPRQAFILHSDEKLLASSTKVKDGIAMTSDAKLLLEIARGKGPREALLIFGYAGWAPGQLESELKADSWFAVPADKAVIFGKEAEKKWRQAIDKRQIPL
jgi:putative transcriptional regulator